MWYERMDLEDWFDTYQFAVDYDVGESAVAVVLEKGIDRVAEESFRPVGDVEVVVPVAVVVAPGDVGAYAAGAGGVGRVGDASKLGRRWRGAQDRDQRAEEETAVHGIHGTTATTFSLR